MPRTRCTCPHQDAQEPLNMHDASCPVRARRDEWCTPYWLANGLGHFDLDPCSNSRSHIFANEKRGLEWGLDGLDPVQCYPTGLRTFVNPPYSRGQVAKWVEMYKHTDFCFLLRWDPSTAWFKELMRETNYVWFANQRINFEPPAGIQSSSNPYPHALFFRSQPPQGLQGLGMTLTNDSIRRYTRESNISRIQRSAFAGVGGSGY